MPGKTINLEFGKYSASGFADEGSTAVSLLPHINSVGTLASLAKFFPVRAGPNSSPHNAQRVLEQPGFASGAM